MPYCGASPNADCRSSSVTARARALFPACVPHSRSADTRTRKEHPPRRQRPSALQQSVGVRNASERERERERGRGRGGLSVCREWRRLRPVGEATFCALESVPPAVLKTKSKEGRKREGCISEWALFSRSRCHKISVVNFAGVRRGQRQTEGSGMGHLV